MKVYGIKNCDTVKKALKWLSDNGFNPELQDYRVQGIDPQWLAEMADKFGWENLVNKRSTTWRNLDDSLKTDLNREKALSLLLEQPTLIKRPIVLDGDVALLGFNANDYEKAFR
ncbi:arsenate reductase [Pasteurellaceae bacterium Macca]|nr:arsenate reductase [Pasteurellaceae bacterium Macca]